MSAFKQLFSFPFDFFEIYWELKIIYLYATFRNLISINFVSKFSILPTSNIDDSNLIHLDLHKGTWNTQFWTSFCSGFFVEIHSFKICEKADVKIHKFGFILRIYFYFTFFNELFKFYCNHCFDSCLLCKCLPSEASPCSSMRTADVQMCGPRYLPSEGFEVWWRSRLHPSLGGRRLWTHDYQCDREAGYYLIRLLMSLQSFNRILWK